MRPGVGGRTCFWGLGGEPKGEGGDGEIRRVKQFYPGTQKAAAGPIADRGARERQEIQGVGVLG